jgi:hypothetical protein
VQNRATRAFIPSKAIDALLKTEGLTLNTWGKVEVFETALIHAHDLWLANCCFADISLGFPFLLRFCGEQSGHSFYPFYCYPGLLARSWRRPFHSCRVPYPQAPTLDRESIPATIAEAMAPRTASSPA